MKRWLHVPVKGGTVTFEVEVTDGVSLHSLRDAFVTVFASDATYAQASGDSELQRRCAVLETQLASAEQERVIVEGQRDALKVSLDTMHRRAQKAEAAAYPVGHAGCQREIDRMRKYRDDREKEYNRIYQNQRTQIQVLTGRLELAGIRAEKAEVLVDDLVKERDALRESLREVLTYANETRYFNGAADKRARALLATAPVGVPR